MSCPCSSFTMITLNVAPETTTHLKPWETLILLAGQSGQQHLNVVWKFTGQPEQLACIVLGAELVERVEDQHYGLLGRGQVENGVELVHQALHVLWVER